MLFVVLSVQAKSPIAVEYMIEFGWLPSGSLNFFDRDENVPSILGPIISGKKESFDLSNTFYMTMNARVFVLDTVFIGGGFDVSVHNIGGIGYTTEGIDYMTTAGFRLWGMLEVFWIHNCFHPAPANIWNDRITPILEGYHDRIGVRVFGRIE